MPASSVGSPSSEKAQRLRLRFARGEEAAAIGHLELSRIWTQAFQAVGAVVSYSQGNRPHPRLTLAAGLPLGVISDAELLDIVLARPIDPADLFPELGRHLPAGLSPIDCREVGVGLPSLPSTVRLAVYEVDVAEPGQDDELERAIDAFLESARLDWEDSRGEKVRRYDLRALVQELRLSGRCDGVARLSMRLRCDAEGVGRPDQVVKALGLPEARQIRRTSLVLADRSPARAAWRKRGRFQA